MKKAKTFVCILMVAVLIAINLSITAMATSSQSPVFRGDSGHANYTFNPAPVSFEGHEWEGAIFAEHIVITVGTVMTAEIHAFTYPGSVRYASILTYADGDWERREGIAVLLNETAPFDARTVTHTFDTPGEFLLNESWVHGYVGDGGMFRISVVGEATQPQPTPTPQPTPQPTPSPATNDVAVTIDGIAQTFEVAPRIINNRTMLPLRAIAEALGMEVDHERATNTAILTLDDLTVTHVIGTNVITVNGVSATFDVASMIIENRTLVPVRMLAEAIGADVEWEPATRTAVIVTA